MTKNNTTITQDEECFSQKGRNLGTNPAYLEPPLIPLVKETYNSKSDEYFIKLKISSDPTSSTSDLCEFKMCLFDYCEPKEFLLFIRDFNKTLTPTGTQDMDAKIQYLCKLVRGEVFA